MWPSCSLLATSAQAVDTIGTLQPDAYLATRETAVDMERIAQVLHDANKDWIRAQSSDGGLTALCMRRAAHS
jgi:hypothetical protein